STAAGVSVAVVVAESYATLAATAVPSGFFSVQLVLVIVAESIPRENVAVGCAPVATPVAPLAGVVAVTAGGAGAAAVVKLQLAGVPSATPSLEATVASSRAV